MIRKERLTANLEGEFVVFLIGLRINNPLKLHKWLPVAMAMPRMLQELYSQPELGFIHAETWFSRTIILVQYWRSMDQLLEYAKNRNAEHLPAWQAFNKSVGTDGSVGIWHETYMASPGTYENVNANMPPFGLGKAGTLSPATGGSNLRPADWAGGRRHSNCRFNSDVDASHCRPLTWALGFSKTKGESNDN